MVVLKHLNPEKLLISKPQSIVLYDTTTNTKSDINLENTEKDSDNITQIAISKSERYFAVLKGKRVIVYDDTLKIVKKISLKRAAHSITLSGNYDVLVADKTGDAYLYKPNETETEVAPLLGHLSTLLDIVLTEDEKFLISCDRDEKIRVSNYPNTYNIESFCLGHKEFVTKIVLLENDYLISASGDGEILIWDYRVGVVLHRIDTTQKILDRETLLEFIRVMEEEKCEVNCLPIVDMQLQKFNTNYYIAVQIHKLNCLQIYSLNFNNNRFESNLIQNLELSCEVIAFSLNQRLFVLTVDGISTFVFSENNFIKAESGLFDNFKLSEEDYYNYDIMTLYKRKFDNVQEYLERKRQRME